MVPARGFPLPRRIHVPAYGEAWLDVGRVVVGGAGRGVAIVRGDGAQRRLPGLGQPRVLGLGGGGTRGVVTPEGLESGLNAGGGEPGEHVGLPTVLHDGDEAVELLSVGRGEEEEEKGGIKL